MSANLLKLNSLVFDESVYPRCNVDEMHVRSMMHAMEGGIEMPPILVERKTNRIVDGVHRYHAALRSGHKTIRGVLKTYASEKELFKDAVAGNVGVGLKLGTDDSLRVIDLATKLGFKEIDQAAMLRTSIAHLRALAPRFATVNEASELRRIPLKASCRHFAGEKISKKQAEAMEGAPGNSYLLLTNQLVSALLNDLLPPSDRHPALWERLDELHGLLGATLGKKRAA